MWPFRKHCKYIKQGYETTLCTSVVRKKKIYLHTQEWKDGKVVTNKKFIESYWECYIHGRLD